MKKLRLALVAMVALLALVGTKTFADEFKHLYIVNGYDDYMWGEHEDHLFVMSNYPVFGDGLITGCIITDTNYKVQIVDQNEEVANIIMAGGNFEADGFSNQSLTKVLAESLGECD
ncbi:hypothetical protein [Nitrincola nitratireducens]|uniref:DUF2511 domain-containing protein n=1 Tax=Nitrincola nitratireducens TaxID=1229521 RepID=W9UUJ7_9GAMM|nr:hypothetical protein [Nitrincola nitratireducens]EXJ10903.1 hypothetical protein D791_02268 [Nitrincola nitratireducens]